MASNCAVGICRRSNTQFSAEGTPSGSLSFVRHVSTTSVHGTKRTWSDVRLESASLIGRSRSSTFRPSTTAVSMSLAGSCFSTESAPRPFHHGIRGRGGTIFRAALPSVERQDQADSRTHLIHRPARDILPLLGGSRIFSYRV
jgi:hypothetical protein